MLDHERALALLLTWAVCGMVPALVRPVRTHDPIELGAEPRGCCSRCS